MQGVASELTAQLRMRSYIQRVATGPQMSKSVSLSEASDAMLSILSGDIDPVQSAIYLIALRMKRETDDEFKGSLQGLCQKVVQESVDVADLVDIADPFDGFARCVPASSFLPAVLAALNVPALLQGADSIGPKYGVTHRKILAAARCNVDLSPQQAARQIENNDISWAYLDQYQSCPALHALVPLRERMVKRSVLTTIETLSKPLTARATHMLGGFVHRAYSPVYTMLAREAGFSSAMVVKGVEGGVIPSLSQVSRMFTMDQDIAEPQQIRLDPSALGIEQDERVLALPSDLPAPAARPDQLAVAVDTQALAQHAAKCGLAALNGEQGLVYDSLVYGAAICLAHLGRAKSMRHGADLARAAIDSGKARAHFLAAA